MSNIDIWLGSPKKDSPAFYITLGTRLQVDVAFTSSVVMTTLDSHVDDKNPDGHQTTTATLSGVFLTSHVFVMTMCICRGTNVCMYAGRRVGMYEFQCPHNKLPTT